MRIFELARELNIPGKDLIDRIRTMGMTVEGNFMDLDQKMVKEIKAKMLEPVTRVQQDSATSEDESEEQPRKRRIISARRSKEVTRIQESLGASGPLPEDRQTREEVASQPPVGDEVAAGESTAEIAAETQVDAQPTLEPGAETPVREGAPVTEALEQPAEAPPADVAATAAAPDGAKPQVPPTAAAAQKAPLSVADQAERARLRELHRLAIEEEAKTSGTPEKAKWKDFKRTDRKQPVARLGTEEEWLRPSRKRGDKRGGRGGRRPAMDGEQKHVFLPRKKAIRLGPMVTVAELAGALGVKAREIIRKLMAMGLMVTINDPIDGTTAELIAAEFDIQVEVDTADLEDLVKQKKIDPKTMKLRPAIVTIMGHVDHGKTSLLDFIRSSQITSGEAGGITQHIGAYMVRSEAGDIAFLDTPGHEAFTALRARGANITDLVVLVVAADDGVMPQTVEAIDHARAAGVPIMVALNKMDRPGADPDKIKRQLMEHELLTEDFGGETVLVPVSAATGMGIPDLLEMIHLQSEMLDLKALHDGKARGFVIEAKMDRQRGPVATVIIRQGTLRVGDHFVAGTTFGRVRALQDDRGAVVEEATPSHPVEVLGYDELPQAGDEFVVTEDEKSARQVSEIRHERQREADSADKRRIRLEDFLQTGGAEEITTLPLVLKADTQGSLEALRASLDKQGNPTAKISVVRAGVGGISETDISLAATTNSVVIGFNVRADNKATDQARTEGVDIKLYTIIYELIGDVRAALQGLLKPIIREEVIGHCEVRELFSSTKEGQIAGGFIIDGRLERNSMVRLFRENVIIHTGSLDSLRRFKEDVSNVANGYECGVRISKFNDLKVGDLIEAFVKIEEAQVLDAPGQRSGGRS